MSIPAFKFKLPALDNAPPDLPPWDISEDTPLTVDPEAVHEAIIKDDKVTGGNRNVIVANLSNDVTLPTPHVLALRTINHALTLLPLDTAGPELNDVEVHLNCALEILSRLISQREFK